MLTVDVVAVYELNQGRCAVGVEMAHKSFPVKVCTKFHLKILFASDF